MTTLMRWLMIVLALAGAILAGYLCWRVMRVYWAPIFVVAYLTIGGIITAVGIVGLIFARKKINPNSVFLTLNEAQARTRASQLRIISGKILGLIGFATAGWIDQFSLMLKIFLHAARTGQQRTLGRDAAFATLQGVGHRTAPIVLFASIAAYLTALAQPSEVYWARLFLIILGVHVVSRQLEYAITPTPLPVQLRRKLGNAYLTFVTIALSDVISLVLILNSVFNWPRGDIISLSALTSVFQGLFFGHLTELIQKPFYGQLVPVKDALLPAIGALLSLNFVETAYKFREFRRTDQDNLAIAANYSMTGRFADALATLDKVTSYTREYYSVRAVAHLGVSQSDRAWSDASLVTSLKPNVPPHEAGKRNVSANEIFLLLVGAFPIVGFLPGFLPAFKLAANSGVSDVCLASGAMIFFEDLDLLPKIAPTLSEIATEHHLPMLHAVALFADGDRPGSIAELAQIKPASAADKFLCESAKTLFTISDPNSSPEQDRTVFSTWSVKALEELGRIDFSTFEPADLPLIYGRVLQISKISEVICPEYQQAWQYILNELQKKLPVNPQQAFFFDWLKKSEL